MVKIVKKMKTPRERNNEITKVATEILLAKLLAGNDKRLRDRGIERLRKWVKARSQSCSNFFTQDDLMRIWKGLFYCMWMSDKPLVQEELTETISKLIHNFAQADGGILFVRCFFLTMQTEWFGIDHLRLDKFMMLCRRFLRQAFQYCDHWKWKAEVTDGLGEALSATVLIADATGPAPLGFTLHITEVFLEELAKVGRGQLPPEVTTELVRPFVQFLAKVKDGRSKRQVLHHVFRHLMKQSELGQEFKEKFDAWQEAGFPGTSWRDMKKVENSEEEMDLDSEDKELMEMGEGPKDPRAGKVDVYLPRLDFDATKISELFRAQRRVTFPLANRRTLHGLSHQFAQMAEGHYPLATGTKLKKMLSKINSQKGRVRKATSRLYSFEVQLHREEKKQGFGKLTKKQKTKLKQTNNGVEMEEPQSKDEVKNNKHTTKERGRSKKALLEDNLNTSETNNKVADKKKRALERKVPVQKEEINMETWHIPMSLEKTPLPNLKKKKCTGESSNGISSLKAFSKLYVTLKTKKGNCVAALNSAQSTETSATKVRNIMPTKIGPGSWKQNVEVEFEVTPGVYKKMKRRVPETPVQVELLKKCRFRVEVPSSGKQSVIRGKDRCSSGVLGVEPCPSVMQNGLSSDMKVTLGSGKRVNIVLMKNKEQAESEYLEAVKQSPGIPFDVNNKPIQGILKRSSFRSPINPFYNKPLKRLCKKRL